MRRLILHIGAGKCGSSSIQSMLRKAARASKHQRIGYQKLKSAGILKLNRSDPEALNNTVQQLRAHGRVDVLIISHEYLQQQFVAVRNICGIAAELGFQSIQIVGYTRRQDQWQKSSFNQWSFRNINQLKRGRRSLEEINCNWQLFSGYERWLITCIFNQEGPYWNTHYDQHAEMMSNHPIPVQLLSSPMPSSSSPAELLHHFNNICKLDLNDSFINRCKPIRNSSFSEYITESVADSILQNSEDAYPITPHTNNQILRALSADLPRQIPDFNVAFVKELKMQYLKLFQNSNQAYCDQFKISFSEYFGDPTTSNALNRSEFKMLIQKENSQRLKNTSDIYAKKAAIHGCCTKAMLDLLIKSGNSKIPTQRQP